MENNGRNKRPRITRSSAERVSTQNRPFHARAQYNSNYNRYNRYGGEGEQESFRPAGYNDGQERQERPYGDRLYGERPRSRGYGDRLYGERPRNNYEERPRSNYEERPRSNYEERPRSNYEERPQSSYKPKSYGQKPYGQKQYGQKPYGQKPYGQKPYGQKPKYNGKRRVEYKDANLDPNEPIRLNRYLANAGVCSRREADDFIQAGVVSVNGEVVTELGTKILRTDRVVFHDQPVTLEKKVYVLLNKPKDYVTTVDDPEQRKTVMDLVRKACPERIYPVGRLDRNTTGVLLLTNDGDLASKLTHPRYLKKKIYHVHLDKNVALHDLHQIDEGIELEDGPSKADAVEYSSPTEKDQVGIEIHSGKNRIVRRIFEHLGYHVTKLDRVQFCGLTKKNVKRGDWRFLTEKEVDMLRMGAFE